MRFNPTLAGLMGGAIGGIVLSFIGGAMLNLNPWTALFLFALFWVPYSFITLRRRSSTDPVMPQTFEEAVATAHKMFLNGDEAAVQALEEDLDNFTAMVHHSAGRWIRNNWGLWKREGRLFDELWRVTGLDHADDLSTLILVGVWHLHRNSDARADIRKTVERCKAHWESMK